jgi:hypothetical protein
LKLLDFIKVMEKFVAATIKDAYAFPPLDGVGLRRGWKKAFVYTLISSPLMGEDQGEGEKRLSFIRLFAPSHPKRRNDFPFLIRNSVINVMISK